MLTCHFPKPAFSLVRGKLLAADFLFATFIVVAVRRYVKVDGNGEYSAG
jgi:hypothetical protein